MLLEEHMRSRCNAWRSIAASAVAAMVMATFVVAALAQANYPTRPVRIVCLTDRGVAYVSTRLVAALNQPASGTELLHRKSAGAGGIVAAKDALSFPETATRCTFQVTALRAASLCS